MANTSSPQGPQINVYQNSKHIQITGSTMSGGQVFNSDGSEDARRSKILEWVSAIPYTSHHKRISDGRLDGTGMWIFNRHEYREWDSSTESMLLLLRGIPGAGKTYLASTVIDYFLSNPTSGKLAYFYCNRAEESRRDPESILSTLVQQLAQKPGEKKLLQPVIDTYEDREKEGQKSSRLSITESQKLLVQLTDIYPLTVICIDALDEVNDKIRLQLLKSLKHMMEKSKRPVKIFATTRMDIDILLHFEGFPRIELKPADNVEDINWFVETSIRDAIKDRRLLLGAVDDEFQAEICDVLRRRSEGMFQLAALHIDFLCEKSTPGDVRLGLAALPSTLTDAYDKAYNHILEQEGSARRLALNAFYWIKYSHEPLRSKTLLDAITVEVSDSGEFSRSDAGFTANDLLKACQNLLILDGRLDVFRFAHLSVDEFLETQLCKRDPHTVIAKVCLSLLCTPSAYGGYDTELETREGRYMGRHLLLYSAVFWPWHFSRCENECTTLTSLWKTLISAANYQRWLGYHRRCLTFECSTDNYWLRSKAMQAEGGEILFLVCIFVLGRKFETVFKANYEKKTRISRLLTMIGLRRKLGSAFRSLFIETANIDRYLLKICQLGDLSIVEQLLAVGADVSTVDSYGLAPLAIALGHRNEALARLLIDWGANVSAADKDGRTRLARASECGDEALARLLIDLGADVSAADKTGRTPLWLALYYRNEAVARLLIDQGADVSAADKTGWTPLAIVLEYRNEAIARLLIHRGADVSAADKYGRTPLAIALEFGCEAVARLLIDQGAGVSAADKAGRTPLALASKFGSEAVARLLIDRGADVSAADKTGRTPLAIVLEYRNEAIARLLIHRGADVSAADKYGRTPLAIALEFGCEAAARLLIDQGVGVSAADKTGRTPLALASKFGSEAVARLLTDRGADVSAADKTGRTPLWLALYYRNEAVAQLLIDRGADVSAADKTGRTPLWLALYYRNEAVARLLIDRGADVSAADKTGRTPLALASEFGNEAVARLLKPPATTTGRR